MAGRRREQSTVRHRRCRRSAVRHRQAIDPLIAIELQALKSRDNVAFVFTKVMGELGFGMDEGTTSTPSSSADGHAATNDCVQRQERPISSQHDSGIQRRAVMERRTKVALYKAGGIFSTNAGLPPPKLAEVGDRGRGRFRAT